MARKTVDVELVRNLANGMLEASHDDADRNGIIVMLEAILHKSGNYKGFRYTRLMYNVDGTDTSDPTVNWDYTDETRRLYF